jgi:biopolymer transport protein ExbB
VNESSPSPDVVEQGVNVLQSGGIFMIPILLLSVVGVAIIVQRALVLRRALLLPPELEAGVERLQHGAQPEGVAHLAAQAVNDPSPLGRILMAAWQRREQGSESLRLGVEAVAREQVGKLQSGLPMLEVIITIAPLLGLLGTLSGLITVFGGLGSTAALEQPDAGVIAAGIAEALFHHRGRAGCLRADRDCPQLVQPAH